MLVRQRFLRIVYVSIFKIRAGEIIKTMALVAEIFDTDWIETESEVDALFLESEMIKRYMPRYNVLLRDDKSSDVCSD